MAIGQLRLPDWIGAGEPAGAPMLRGAQAGATIANSFTSAYNARKNREQREKEFAAGEPLRDLQAQAFAADVYMKNREKRDAQEADVEYAAWYAEHGHLGPQEIYNAPIPQNPLAAQRVASFKALYSQTQAATQYANDIADFNKRLSTLPGHLRARFFNKIKNAPTAEQWTELADAERESAQERIQGLGGAGVHRVSFKDPVTGETHTWSTEQGTTTQRDLKWADEQDEIAESLKRAGFHAEAEKYIRNAALARSRLEGGPSSNDGWLQRQKLALEQEIAEIKQRIASGQKTLTKGTSVVSLNLQRDLDALNARLREVERSMAASPGGAPDEQEQGDPLGLWSDE